MADVSSWLRGQRKYELVELAQSAGLKDYEHLKKIDLEIVLDQYLRENEVTLSKHSVFNPFYTRHRSGASPTKRDSGAMTSGVVAVELETKPVRSRTRRATKAAEEVEVAQTDDSSPEPNENRYPTAVATRTPRQSLSLSNAIPLPPSPAVVADVIDQSTAELRSRMGDVWEDVGLRERAESLRDYLSSVVSIETAILAIEANGLRSEVLPLRYAFTMPPVSGLTSSAMAVHLPDLFVVLTSSFWSPVILWSITSLFAPLLFGYFFNLTLRARQAHSGQQTHQPTHRVDPLTFNITKALISYLVYSQRFRLGLFVDETIDRTQAAIPGGLHGLLIGAAIGGLTSLYEAILKK
ncbi:MAG: hypothetical protein M1823_000241 [Watsoniomyces obsoletus]|nr:MAG: hypothetical protein M1823_000241 [Watsoniomyces obsoletus]